LCAAERRPGIELYIFHEDGRELGRVSANHNGYIGDRRIFLFCNMASEYTKIK
jgi:hypothetical protein